MINLKVTGCELTIAIGTALTKLGDKLSFEGFREVLASCKTVAFYG